MSAPRPMQDPPIADRRSSLGHWLSHPWSLRLSRWFLGAVMLYAAWPKIVDPPGFAQAVHGYGLLPLGAVAPLALVLPWIEAGSGLALLTGLGRRAGAVLVLAAMFTFSAALALNLARGNPVDCGCFGGAKVARTKEQRLGDMKLALLRDLALALLALQALRRPNSENQESRIEH